jgi:hypothetical protein
MSTKDPLPFAFQRGSQAGEPVGDGSDDDPLGVLVAGTNALREPFIQLFRFPLRRLCMGRDSEKLDENKKEGRDVKPKAIRGHGAQ